MLWSRRSPRRPVVFPRATLRHRVNHMVICISVQVQAPVFVFQGVPFVGDGAKAGVSCRTDPVARLVSFLYVLFWTPRSQIDG